MMKKLLLGNAAVARGALEAGVKFASAYPGTPSTEITETLATYSEMYCEWAPNEKVAVESAYGASLAGARALACMKHVGVNVAADPIFTAAYTGVNAGLVLVVADDPGMHSSQNEQDSRFYARSAHIPMLEPADSQEAKEFTKLAFELSERYDTPVFVRMTTRISHSQSFVDCEDVVERNHKPYRKDPEKYVMVPANAIRRHCVVEEREKCFERDACDFPINRIEYRDKRIGVVCAGAVYQYVREALPDCSTLKLGAVYPLPFELIREFAYEVQELYVIEELEPFLEDQLKAKGIACKGKALFSLQGEFSANIVREKFDKNFHAPEPGGGLPNRPPVMCAGCPHRGIFYVLNKLKLNVCGDIGCYSLGAAPPLSAIDAVLCMGASISMAHGRVKALGPEAQKNTVAVIGDSTFAHTGINSLMNAVYNQSDITVIILDNSTTGMTGHQNHAMTGVTIYDEPTTHIDVVKLCEAIGCASVRVVDAYRLEECEQAIREELPKKGVSVIIARMPCALLKKKGVRNRPLWIDPDKCRRCRQCVKLGCPAIMAQDSVPRIDRSACVGCGVCEEVCKFGAIDRTEG